MTTALKMTEDEARETLLTICRNTPGRCMRVKPNLDCVVVNVNFHPSRVVAKGRTWNEVLAQVEAA